MFGIDTKRLIILSLIGISYIWRSAILSPVSFRPTDLTGKTYVMAGGTSGIGLEAARAFASWNATVIIGSRSAVKGEKVRADLVETLPPGSTGTIQMIPLDLASFESVKSFASSVASAHSKIDVLVLNAGMHGNEAAILTADGVEEVYQTNFLSHYLLANLLLPTLRQTPGARITHTSSSMHFLGAIDKVAHSAVSRNSGSSRARTGIKSYCDTKLMNVMFSNYLDRTEPKIMSIATHPGLVATDLDRNQPAMVAKAMRAFREVTSRPAVDGAVTLVTASTLVDPVFKGGAYLEDTCIMNNCTVMNPLCVYSSVKENGGGVVPHGTASDEREQDWLMGQAKEMVKAWL